MARDSSRAFSSHPPRPQGRRTAVDTVIDEIKNLLKTGQLKPGDRLPNETDLSQIFGTSRGPIREAVKALVALGILEIRRGDGTYISTSSATTAVDYLLFHLLLDRPEEVELRQLRYMMELSMVDILIESATSEDVESLESLNHQMSEHIESGSDDIERITQLDLAFHKALAKATRNKLVERIYDFTLELFSSSIMKTHSLPEAGNVSTQVHQSILEGIRERDREKTRAAVVRSLKVWESLSTEPGSLA